MNQVTVFVVPGTLIFLELFSGTEFLADAENTGEDAIRRDLQIGGEKGTPVEIFHCTALEAEDVVDWGNHQIEILGPINEAAGRLFALAAMTGINKVSEGLESKFSYRRSVYIKHAEQGLGLVRVGEIRIIEHDENLEDHAEVGANWVIRAGDGDFIREVKTSHCNDSRQYDKMINNKRDIRRNQDGTV